MTYGIIDLEFTSWIGSLQRNWNLPKERKEIIQIGAIKFENFKSDKLRKFSCFVKPKFNSDLSLYVRKLTNISQKNINEDSYNFKQSSKLLKNFLYSTKKIYCNGLDKDILEYNYKINNLPKDLFLKKIINIKKINNKIDIGMSSELSHSFKLKIKKHDALSDCINIFYYIRDNLKNLNI